MSDPCVSKIIYGNNTLIDLTSDDVTADKVLAGYHCHDASGAQITGTAGAYIDGSTTVIPSSQASIDGTVTTLL